MARYRPTRTLPALRPWLLKVHTDLLAVHDRIDPFAAYFPDELSTFEKMVIVLEDRRFFDHGAVDFVAVLRALYKAVFCQVYEGASTIDMQFVRTATGYRERRLRRKLYEVFLASVVQFRYSKVTILRSYLNIAYFGWRLKGADDAAQAIFGRSTDRLELDEAAFLAAMLVFPLPRQPSIEWRHKILRRANHIKATYVRHKERFDEIARRKMA